MNIADVPLVRPTARATSGHIADTVVSHAFSGLVGLLVRSSASMCVTKAKIELKVNMPKIGEFMVLSVVIRRVLGVDQPDPLGCNAVLVH